MPVEQTGVATIRMHCGCCGTAPWTAGVPYQPENEDEPLVLINMLCRHGECVIGYMRHVGWVQDADAQQPVSVVIEGVE